MARVRVDEALLAEVVRRLVAAVDSDRIILFGSRARGDFHTDSDVDLLIVKDSTEKPHRRPIPAYQSLNGLGISKDILWYTPQEVQEWAEARNHVVARAFREGRVLYERRLPPECLP